MKKGFFLQSLVCLLAVSCSVQELDTKDVASYGDDVFYASLESSDTRVYVDEDIKILWDKNDQISIFNLTTQNQQFQFNGKTGDNAGTFSQVTEPVGPEESFPFICAVYPYQNSTIINKEGVLTVTLPEEQVYREGSFGPGANTMVSSTDDHLLKFKNLGGYLVLKLYGRGVSVSSVSIEGKNNEPLSGKATLKPELGVTPTINMEPTAGKKITLKCETPVELGATKDEPTLFWMVVPPTSFTQGFKLTVTDSHGRVFVKETSASLSVNRNEVLRISAIKVRPVPVNYAKASSITAGGTYLIVDAEDKRLFKGAVDGSYVTVEPDKNGVITDNVGTLADYEFTVENSGSNYYLMFNDGKYLICDYTNNSSAGLAYVDTPSDMKYPYSLTTGDNGAFFFSTTNVQNSASSQVIYYKPGSGSGSDVFKIGGSGSNIGVHLYKKDGKLDRGLRFDLESVTCTPGSTPEKPVLLGTYTTISYSSSNDNIATVDDDGNVTPLAAGIVTITASVDEDEQYSAGTASYTLEVKKLDRGMSFNPQKVTCLLDGTPEKPVLSGKFTTVTYSSSNSKIATVDADGNVSPHAMGIVTITASAAEDGQYEAGSASYTLRIKSSSTFQKYVRVTSADQINLEGEYVIVYENGQTQKVFKPVLNAGKNAFMTTDNAADVTVLDNEIEASKVEGCQFMLANQDGTNKKFSLLVPEADGTTDYYFIVYGREEANTGTMTVFFASPTATGFRSTFNLSSSGVLTINGNSGYNFQYSSSGYFTAATGSSSNLYLFVRAEGSVKQKQTLSFAEPTVTWALGDDYAVGNSYDYPQVATGAQTTVTYTCEPESVAKIENGRIKIVGPGSATVTATAAATDLYYSATATYTLRILRAAPGGWVDLGSFNLENEALTAYLNDAELTYTDTNDDNVTVMNKYVSTYSYIARKDCPNPVKIEWTNPASNATVISIYKNDSLDNPVWTQNATANATAAEVYNLIPGRKYYYSVSENGTVLEKGFFNTTGRRRMIKVSDTMGKGRANNCRDLGGLVVKDNGVEKTIQYGFLYRGTCMDATTDTEKDFIVGFMNVGLDVDLRDGNANSPGGNDGNSVCYQPFGANYNVAYNSQKFASGKTIADLTTPEKVYNVLTDIFTTLNSGKSVYFHCHIGADRTGYMAMLIEGLLGVSEKDCSIDYELTSFSNAAGSRYRNGEPVWYTFRDGIAFLRNLPGDTFQEKIETYLIETVGISQTDIDKFKSLVLK